MNTYIINLRGSFHSIPPPRQETYDSVIGTCANRSFIPRFANEKSEYKFPKVSIVPHNKLSSYNEMLVLLSGVFWNTGFKEFHYRDYPFFRLRMAPGLIYEIVGKPVVHFMITENTGNNTFIKDKRRYFISKEFYSSNRFKYVYKAINESILLEDSDSSIVITDNILDIMFDEVKLPKFDNLEDRIAFQENIYTIITENIAEKDSYNIITENTYTIITEPDNSSAEEDPLNDLWASGWSPLTITGTTTS